MALPTKEEARAILQKVISFSKADECEANLTANLTGNVRFARNSVSTSGHVADMGLVVQSSFGKKSGTATINEFDDESLRKVVLRSEELAQFAPENPEYMSLLGPQQYDENPAAYSNETAQLTPDQRAQVAKASIEQASSKKAIAAGFFEDTALMKAMMNSKGLFAYHRETEARYTLTARTEDAKGSGYVSRSVTNFKDFDPSAAAAIAVGKAVTSNDAKAIEPGKYTVILEPNALVVLLEGMLFNMDARSMDEGRSFLSKAGGGNRLGEKLVDERVNLYSDPLDPLLPTATWADDGRPQKKIKWIENGVVKDLFYSRYWAQKQGKPATPQPTNLLMMGTDKSTEDLIRSTERGVLVTRLWYIRPVDPQTVLLTGLTRDGTFYIENGKIKHPIKNFRFNESPVIMLNNLEELGKPQRVLSAESNNSYIIPPIKVRDFTFSSLSDAV